MRPGASHAPRGDEVRSALCLYARCADGPKRRDASDVALGGRGLVGGGDARPCRVNECRPALAEAGRWSLFLGNVLVDLFLPARHRGADIQRRIQAVLLGRRRDGGRFGHGLRSFLFPGRRLVDGG
ncbi:uncharacterized protein CMC5_008270 [Chondromyces crocatus]|uniref:Uncharacterized protein n=1 Tax=Chondromyces crocatus TaxID=52 RepID=A0A0K1E753_CHOCO|nr:uncharacterized protein CMC5_008270 [Chondromyces crocatus]